MNECAHYRADGVCTNVRPGRDGLVLAITNRVIWISDTGAFPTLARDRIISAFDGERMVCEGLYSAEKQSTCSGYEEKKDTT